MLVTYDAYLTLPDLSPSVQEEIRALGARFHLDVIVSTTWVEFQYSGRDRERRVVAFLKALAPLLGTAEGDVTCTTDRNDDGNEILEFYSIADGKLYCENGTIVRSDRRLVE